MRLGRVPRGYAVSPNSPRPRGTVATPTTPLAEASGAVVDAAGTLDTPTGTTPGAGAFDAALVRIAPTP